MRRHAVMGGLILGLACGPGRAPPLGTEASGTEASGGASSSSGATAVDGTSTTGTGASSETSSTTTTTAEDTSSGSSGAEPMTDDCQGEIDQCNDGVDNDGDGLIDLADPECLSPCDNTEHELGSTFVGDNLDCQVDCAFDATFGAGDDGCRADLRCDPAGPGGRNCDAPPPPRCPPPASPMCLEVCLPRTPNGCDCYGCCAFDVDGMSTFLYMGLHSHCGLDDRTACNPCTPDMSCFDPCDQPCEVCVGSTAPPPGCAQADCDGAELPCTIDAQGQHDCPDGYYCITGCCLPDP